MLAVRVANNCRRLTFLRTHLRVIGLSSFRVESRPERRSVQHWDYWNDCNKVGLAVGVTAGVGAVATIVAAPLVVAGLGFGAGGVVAGSTAAGMMSAAGNVAAGAYCCTIVICKLQYCASATVCLAGE